MANSYGTTRDLATRHEKTLHVDQYSPPDRIYRQSSSTGHFAPSPNSPDTLTSKGDERSPQEPHKGTEFDHPKAISTPSQPTDDMSEARAWFTLLGLDGFDPFPNDGSLYGGPLPGSSSMIDEFRLADTESFVPIEPKNSNHIPNRALNANIELTLGRTFGEIPPSASPEIHGINSHPQPPTLPGIGLQVFPVRISEAKLSSLTNLIRGEKHQRPTAAMLKLFLGTYFGGFNVHLPMLHAPSFDFDHQPPGLLLIMAAIGALCRLEHRSATLLYWAADEAAPVGASPFQTQTSEQRIPSMAPGQAASGNLHCLSYFQTRLLLQYFGILGGDKDLADRSLGMIAELSLTLYRTLSRRLKSSSNVIEEELMWAGWLDRERTKRTLYGAWIISDFVSSIYGTAPPFTIGHDGQLELPCSEALWQAENENEWKEARLTDSDHGAGSCLTIRDAFAQLVDNSEQDSPGQTALKWSPFAIVCIMHILSTRFWHVSHGTLSAVTSTSRGLTGTVTSLGGHGSNTSNVIPRLFATAARRCHDFIRAYSEHVEQDLTLRRPQDARWQVANAADVLRVCYGRTVPALARLDCDTLLRGDDDDVRVAMEEHVRMPLERTAEFTLAASVAFEGLSGPLQYGAQLYRKTGALTGGLEHLISAWDGVLLLSKWTHVVCTAGAMGIELDDGERDLLQRISDLLQQEEAVLDDGSPLAARLLRFWATFYEDTWVWGVAPRMAVVFRRLAAAYQAVPG